MKQHPPRQIFEKLVNKNAIKCKTGGPPLAIFPETLDPPPPRNFGKNIPYPLPWCASMTETFLKPKMPLLELSTYCQKLQVLFWHKIESSNNGIYGFLKVLSYCRKLHALFGTRSKVFKLIELQLVPVANF
jgi:hypothetical protein